MNIALLYAAWPGEGNFSTPKGFHQELLVRAHKVRHFNLYHGNGEVTNKQGHRFYSNEGLNTLITEYNSDYFKPDVLYLFDYGVYDCIYLSKTTFPDVLLVSELGDLPQAFGNHRSKIGKFDLYFAPCHQSVETLKKFGHNAHWQTHFADTRWFYPRNIVKDTLVTTTCGSRGYAHLTGLTDKLKDVFGDSFKNERYFYGLDHGDFLAKGHINFQCSQFGEVTRRVFEGMAVGNMMLTDRLSEKTHINDLFIEDKDIVYYSSIDECIDKIKYYMNNDKERLAIAKSGHDKVIANHSITARVDEWEKIVNDHLNSRSL